MKVRTATKADFNVSVVASVLFSPIKALPAVLCSSCDVYNRSLCSIDVVFICILIFLPQSYSLDM